MRRATHLLFKRGLHEGVVHLTNMRLVLMGPPCVGKTSFKSLLFKWPAPKVHDSTALATRPIRAIERVAERSEGKIWVKITGLDLLQMLSDAIIAIEEESQENDSHSSEKAMNPVSLVDLESQLSDIFQISSVEQSFALEECDNTNDDVSCPAIGSSIVSSSSTLPTPTNEELLHATADIPQHTSMLSENDTNSGATIPKQPSLSKHNPAVDENSSKMVELLTKRNASKNRHKATWINVLDSGGQPQFADVSRAFIRGNTMNIICTKLTENLSDKPKFCYSLNGKLLSQPSELQMTNLQLIEHFVRSIVASKNAFKVKGNKRLPLFMIIGTFYDKIKGSKEKAFESLRAKNELLLSTLHEFRDHFIFSSNDPEELIFPVDNMCWWNRKKTSSYFRQLIMSYQTDIGISLPIPVRWYMFEMRLKEEASQEEHGMISLESCCSIGVNFSMNQSDVQKSIIYLQSMALFLYFPAVLPNVIFTNPQYLLDMLSALIRVSFVKSLEDVLPEGQSLEPEAQHIFRNDGVFDGSLLDKVCLPFVSSLFSAQSFLKLLRYLHIIAPLSSSDLLKKYFMPVVLPPHQMTEDHIAVFKRTCDPMVVAFETKIVPQVRYT